MNFGTGIMRRILMVMASFVALIGAASADERFVNLFAWADYFDPRVLEEFTQETGIGVVYDTYDSNEAFDARMREGPAGLDVVLTGAQALWNRARAGAYQKLDRSKLTNAKYLWPEVMSRLAVFDPGNQYAVNYMWFTAGIAYDEAKTKVRLGGKPIDSWDAIFRPENLRRLSDCGVYLPDSPEGVFPTVLKFLGAKPDSKSPEDIRRAADLLVRLKPQIKKFHSSEYVDALSSGEICVAMGWTGDAYQAKRRSLEAKNGVNLQYSIPRDGAQMLLDNLAIQKDAPHPAEAYALIDFLLRPDIAARNTEAIGLANGVFASMSLIDKAITDNPSIYPKDPSLRGLYVVLNGDAAVQATMSREWARVITGKYPAAKTSPVKSRR